MHRWLPIIIAIYVPVSLIITYISILLIILSNLACFFFYPCVLAASSYKRFASVYNVPLQPYSNGIDRGIIVYIRYRQHHFCFEKNDRTRLLHLNTATFITGLLAVFGISLVGNFQATNVTIVHLIGAFMAFGIGFLYLILQTVISYKSILHIFPGNTPCIRRFRLVLCVVDLILLLTFITARQISLSKGPGPGNSLQHWGQYDPGYAEHLVATVSEWLVVFVTVIYFATFYTEFKHFEMKPLEVGCHEYVQRLKGQQVTGPTEETTRNSAKFSSYGTTDLTG